MTPLHCFSWDSQGCRPMTRQVKDALYCGWIRWAMHLRSKSWCPSPWAYRYLYIVSHVAYPTGILCLCTSYPRGNVIDAVFPTTIQNYSQTPYPAYIHTVSRHMNHVSRITSWPPWNCSYLCINIIIMPMTLVRLDQNDHDPTINIHEYWSSLQVDTPVPPDNLTLPRRNLSGSAL